MAVQPHPASIDAYIRHGFSLVPIPPGRKGPTDLGWQRRGAALRSQSDLPPNYGIGLAHAYSGTMALDIDNWDMTILALRQHGIDLSALYLAPDAVVIDSGRPGHGKLLYAMPMGLALPSKRVKVGSAVAYELRCATADGQTVQDVLPPTIHPQTEQPYRWAGNGHWTRLPLLPPSLLDHWQRLLNLAPDDKTAKLPISEESTVVNWAEVESALSAVSSDCSRDQWIEVGMALHWASVQSQSDKGLDLWNQWSAQAPAKYPGEREVGIQWRSFRIDKGQRVTLGSLYHLARENGWVRPAPDVSALFAARPMSAPEVLIHDIRAPIPSVNLDHWPPSLATRAKEVADHVGCDPLVPLLAGLATISGAMDVRSRLELMTGYSVPPIIWALTIGSPADKKSPGSAPMVEPLHALEREDAPAFKARLLDWEGKEAAYTAAKKHFLDVASSPDALLGAPLPHVPDLPDQPQPLRLKVSDTSSQKLVRMCAAHPRGLLCYLDETASWFKKLSSPQSIDDRSSWVQAYEARRYEMDRVGAGTIIAENFGVSVYGNTQPKVLSAALEALATDGLLQRFIPGILNPRLSRVGQPDSVMGADQWAHTVRLVYALPAQTYTLSEEAFSAFRGFQQWFERFKLSEVLLEADSTILTAFGKLEGTTARIALLFHALEAPFSPTVSADTLRRAIRLMREYIVPAWRYLIGEMTGGATFDRWLSQWVLYHAGDGRLSVSLSDVKRGARRHMDRISNPTVQDRIVFDAMATLEESGWVIRTDDRTQEHRHRADWAINPRLAQAFPDQRKEITRARQFQEDERRRIAGIERKIIPGYDLSWDSEPARLSA